MSDALALSVLPDCGEVSGLSINYVKDCSLHGLSPQLLPHSGSEKRKEYAMHHLERISYINVKLSKAILISNNMAGNTHQDCDKNVTQLPFAIRTEPVMAKPLGAHVGQ